MLPAQAQQFTLTHRGFQREPYQGQQGTIARLAAGGKQAGLFTGLQAPVAWASAGWQLDIAHRVVDKDAPFLARHLEDVAEQDQIPLDGRRGDFAQTLVSPTGNVYPADPGDESPGERMAHHQTQAVGLRLGTLLVRSDLFEIAFEQLL